jgi:glycerophosphoryl diester phosphodiesterase
MTRVQELIKIWNIRLHGNGQLEAQTTKTKKPTSTELAELKNLKPEIIAELKKQAEEKAEKEKIAATQKAALIESIKNGSTKIEMKWYEGEILSGYMALGESADLLVEIGAAKWVEGWGYLIESNIVEALGENMTYPQVVEYLRPAKENAEEKVAAKKAQENALFAEAKETGKPVLLKKWMEGCNDPQEECSTDIVYMYAMPDGTTQVKRQHTW